MDILQRENGGINYDPLIKVMIIQSWVVDV